MTINEYGHTYSMGTNPTEPELNFDEAALDKLVELVGSEEEVEAAAKESYEDLLKSFENNDIEMDEETVPEKLAFAALILKLVESGKLGPEEADQFIEEHIG